MRKKLMTRLLIVDAGIVLLCIFFLWVTRLISGDADTCVMHRILHLYCPTCGGTRAVSALLQGKILRALSFFPPVLFAALIGIELHVRTLISYCKKDWTPLRSFPKSRWIWLGISVGIWFVLRNLLLIFWQIDLSGDFLPRALFQ